jgi:hypothetical protein
MNEITLCEEAVLHSPAERAWAVIADYARDPEWRTGVTSMVPTPSGPVQTGTTTVELLRLAGKTWRNEGVVTAVDPGRAFRWRTTGGARANGSRSVEPLDAGACRVRLELNVAPQGIERLAAPVLARMLRRNLRRDLAQLSELVAAAAGQRAIGVA